jgi:hypothetical protein
LVNHFGKHSVDIAFDIFKRFKNILLESAKFLEQFGFGLFDGRFDFGGIDVHGSEMREVFFGLSDDHFEGFDFVIFMWFVETNATNDTVVDAFGFDADQVEDFSDMVSAFTAVWVLELLNFLFFRHFNDSYVLFIKL